MAREWISSHNLTLSSVQTSGDGEKELSVVANQLMELSGDLYERNLEYRVLLIIPRGSFSLIQNKKPRRLTPGMFFDNLILPIYFSFRLPVLA